MQLFSTISLERSFFLIFVLKADDEVRALYFKDSLDHKSGPKYRRESVCHNIRR